MAQFATKADLDKFLRLTTTQPEADLILQLASAAIQNYTGQRLEQVVDDQVKLRGAWGSILWLPERPVDAVAEIRIDTDPALASTQYIWTQLGELRSLFGSWLSPQAVVHVKYTHGFAVIPDDVRGVCLQVAARAYTNPDAVHSESVGAAYNVAHPQERQLQLSDDEKEILGRYAWAPVP